MSEKPLKDQVAIVTGAGRGIGRAIALAFAAAGVNVIGAARTKDEIDQLVQTISEQGGKARACLCDVSDPAQVASLCDLALEHFGGLDIMVVNAGISGWQCSIEQGDPADWRHVFDVNVIGALNQCKSAIPLLRARGGGKIITIGSGAGRSAAPNSSVYGASKAALALLTRQIARETRADHIAVNEIIPGPVRTAIMGFEKGNDEKALARASAKYGDEWLKEPGDVADLAVYLASLPNDGASGQRFSLAGRDIGS